MNELITPGSYVNHPKKKDWGLGQVQSKIGFKVTVNFEDMGKLVIDGSLIALELVN